MDKEIVVDSKIILDILVTSRPGHRYGKLIGMYLIDQRVRITVPMHIMFEIKSGLLEAKQAAKIKGQTLQLNEDISDSTPLQYNFIPIDQIFFDKYFDPELPSLKAGDYLNLALAKHDAIPLLTDDPDQYATARSAGIKVYNSEEFRNICLAALQ